MFNETRLQVNNESLLMENSGVIKGHLRLRVPCAGDPIEGFQNILMRQIRE